MKRTDLERESAFLTADGFCRLFAISRSTLARWRARGLPRVQVGGVTRYPRAAGIRWVWEQELKGRIYEPRDQEADRPMPWTSDDEMEPVLRPRATPNEGAGQHRTTVKSTQRGKK